MYLMAITSHLLCTTRDLFLWFIHCIIEASYESMWKGYLFSIEIYKRGNLSWQNGIQNDKWLNIRAEPPHIEFFWVTFPNPREFCKLIQGTVEIWLVKIEWRLNRYITTALLNNRSLNYKHLECRLNLKLCSVHTIRKDKHNWFEWP